MKIPPKLAAKFWTLPSEAFLFKADPRYQDIPTKDIMLGRYAPSELRRLQAHINSLLRGENPNGTIPA